jgi:hypothetical protein
MLEKLWKIGNLLLSKSLCRNNPRAITQCLGRGFISGEMFEPGLLEQPVEHGVGQN